MVIEIYFYNLLLAVNDLKFIDWMRRELSKRLEMKSIQATKRCLWLDIRRDGSIRLLRLYHRNYANRVLDCFYMTDSCPENTPIENIIVMDPPWGNDGKMKYKSFLYHEDIGISMQLMICHDQILYLWLETSPDSVIACKFRTGTQ